MKKLLFVCLIFLSVNDEARAQLGVFDAMNQATNIINASDQISTSTSQLTTALQGLGVTIEMLDYSQKAFDLLNKVSGKIKTAKSITQAIEMSYRIGTTYSNVVAALGRDKNYTPGEYSLHVANIYSILTSSVEMVSQMTDIITDGSYKMDDKSRLDHIEALSSGLKKNYYKINNYAYRLATYSISRNKVDQSFELVNRIYGL